MHLAAPFNLVRKSCVGYDDRLSRNEFGFGMVLRNLLAMYIGGLGHATRIATTSYLTELPWPRLPNAIQCDEPKKDRVVI